MTNSAIFRITDGATTIDLLSQAYRIVNWEPAAPQLRDGGTFAISAFSHGRRLIDALYDNPIDVFTVTISGDSADTVIRRTRTLRNLIERAQRYWIDPAGSYGPIWLEARAANETEIRYAIIISGQVEKDLNPFAQPFLQAGCRNLQVVEASVEHSFWTDVPPGSTRQLSISGSNIYQNIAINAFDLGDTYDDASIYFGYGGGIFTTELHYVNDDLMVGLDPVSNVGSGYNEYISALRFPNITIPPGSTVRKAWISVTAINTKSGSIAFDVFPIMETDTDGFTAASDIGTITSPNNVVAFARPTGESIQEFFYDTWRAEETYYIEGDTKTGVWATRSDGTPHDVSAAVIGPSRTGSIANLINAIIDQDGWSSGNAIGFYIRQKDVYVQTQGTPYVVPANRDFASFEHPSYAPPTLNVIYDPPATTAPLETSATIIAANKSLRSQITAVLVYDASEDTYASVFPDTSDPIDYALLPDIPAAGDCVYFGVLETDDENVSQPFWNLVFSLNPPLSVNTTIGVWERYIADPAGWDTIDAGLYDGTNKLQSPGVNVVSWSVSTTEGDAWSKTTVNGFTGWWVRLRLTSIVTAPTAIPRQMYQQVYSAIMPRVLLSSEALRGDLPALLRIQASNTRRDYDAYHDALSWIAIGARSLGRGRDFNACITCSKYQNDERTAIFISDQSPTGDTDFSDATGDVFAGGANGAIFCDFNENDALIERFKVVISMPTATSYGGRFRVFARCRVGSTGEQTGQGLTAVGIRLQMRFEVRSEYSALYAAATDEVLATYADDEVPRIIDMGLVSIPEANLAHIMRLTICVYAGQVVIEAAHNLPYVYFEDIYLIPADEMFVISDGFGKRSGYGIETIDIDSARDPRTAISSIVRSADDMGIIRAYHVPQSGAITLPPEKETALWFLFGSHDYSRGTAYVYLRSIPTAPHRIRMEAVARYLTARGDG